MAREYVLIALTVVWLAAVISLISVGIMEAGVALFLVGAIVLVILYIMFFLRRS